MPPLPRSRRAFLHSGARLAAAAALAPQFVPRSVLGQTARAAANSRLNIGLIGLGRQAFYANLPPFLVSADTQVVAVCDVDAWRLGRGRQKVEDHYATMQPGGQYRGCGAYRDFRELLARDDIDAVMISTPDHWHVYMAIAAAQAGKDVALEKPLTLSIAQGRALCQAMSRHQRIFRMDSECRFAEVFRRQCELVRNGCIGDVRRIFAGVPKESPPLAAPPPQPVPEELDYELWLGPAPAQPYTEARVHPRHRLDGRPGWMQIRETCDGMICNWGTHLLDIVQWGNHTEHTGPVEVQGTGRFPEGMLYDVLQDFTVRYRYASGVELTYAMAGRPYVRFEGTRGWIEAEWWKGLEAEPKSILDFKPGPNDVHLPSISEKVDFIQSVKARKPTLVPAEIGHRTNSLCQLGLIAIETGQTLRWDPGAERFTNSDVANARLARPMRPPWTLPSSDASAAARPA